MQNISEAVIKHEAELLFLNQNLSFEEIAKKINLQFGRKYSAQIIKRWAEIEAWADNKNKKELSVKKEISVLPAYALIQKDQYEKSLIVQKMILEQLNETMQSGEKLESRLVANFFDSVRTIMKISGEQIVGNNGNEITKIIMNFNNFQKERGNDIIDVEQLNAD